MLRPVHGGCWWALVIALIASVAWAGPAAAETTLAVDAGYTGAFVPGQAVPVRVRISADRLVRGTLEVGIGTPENGTPAAMAVEVPGGSQKEFLLTAASGLNQTPDVVARLRLDGKVVASGQVTIRAAADTELVGLLPGAVRGRAVPGAAPLAVDVGTARFAAIGEAELLQAPASLGPLSALAADTDELGRLAPAARAGVLRWIDAGGRLLVDSARGQDVPGLPPEWQPGRRGRAAAGLGEVVATDGAIAAGRWSGLIEPSGRGAISARFASQIGLASTLASDAGLRTPRIGWLVGFLAVYVIVVGPLLFLAVRRRGRPELAWVAVPLVAIVFSTGSYVVGRSLREATALVHATVLTSGPAGPVATTYLGVFSRSGETARVGFPAGWTSGSFVDQGLSAAAPSMVTHTADGTDVLMPLETGQFGMVQGSGPLGGPGAGGVEITATAGPGGQVTRTIRNGTTFTLDDGAVFVGGDAMVLGTLAPGEERPFTVQHTDQIGKGSGAADALLWGPGRQGPDAPADFGLWQAAQRSGGLNFTAPSAVVAVGWTRDFVPDVRVGGRTVQPKGRTVVVGRREVTPAASGPAEPAVRRDIVRDPFNNRLGGGGGAGGSVVRFVLPEGADTSKLVLRSGFGSAQFWQDGAWTTVTCDAPSCAGASGPAQINPGCPPGVACPPVVIRGPFGPISELTLPSGSIRDGVIYVRVPGSSIDGPVPLSIGRTA